MDKNQLLEQCAKLLNTHRPVRSGMYCLFVQDGGIGFGELTLYRECKHILARLDSRDVNEGPRTAMWDLIEDRIRRLKEEKVL